METGLKFHGFNTEYVLMSSLPASTMLALFVRKKREGKDFL